MNGARGSAEENRPKYTRKTIHTGNSTLQLLLEKKQAIATHFPCSSITKVKSACQIIIVWVVLGVAGKSYENRSRGLVSSTRNSMVDP